MREGWTPALGRRGQSQGRGRGRWVARALLVVLVAAASGCIVEAEWTPQAVEPVVEPVPDRFVLTDVACPEEGACVAVGSLGTLPTTSELVVVRQEGSAWRRVEAPLPLPGAQEVSCAGPDDCVVRVADALAPGAVDLQYRDGELTVLPGAPLGDSTAWAGTGGAVDCVPGGGCLRTDGSSSTWWDGTGWSEPVPLPDQMMPDTPQLSCLSATSCLLVATEPGIEGWPTPGTVTSTTWDGTAWSPIVTLDHDTRPLDLDCASATACFATAGVRHDYWTDLLPPVPAELLRWDGTGWAVEPVAYPGGAVPTEPGTVSCPSATSCTVLSVAGTGTPPSPTVVAAWDGEAWTGAATDAASPVVALACTSATSCTSAGAEAAQRYDGTTWSDVELPGATSPAEVLAAVSCATEDDCVAVGEAWTLRPQPEGPQLTPTVQRFDGDRWAAEDAGDQRLRHVSCATASSCMVAGSQLGTFWSRHWDGDTWHDLPPVAGQRVGELTGLSCPTATWCLATSSIFAGGGDVAWVWSGESGAGWTELSALPDGTGTTTGLSCTAPGDCVAVANRIGPQVFRLTGNAWSPIDAEGLGAGTTATVDDVDCTSADDCVVVGTGGYVDGWPQALLAVLSDGTWSVTSRAGGSAIDVDCWSVDGCVAVVSGHAPHLEAWDGARWRKVDNPPGLVEPTAVSCGAAGRCEVVGSFVDGASDRATVAGVVLDP